MIDKGLPYCGVFDIGEHDGFIQIPQNYDASRSYPFILFFHGRGGSAFSNNFLADEFLKFRQLAAQKGYIVAVPGYGSDCWMNKSAQTITREMLTFLDTRLNIDHTRFNIMGCSMGGAAALTFTVQNTHDVAAVCDIFGITDFKRFYMEFTNIG